MKRQILKAVAILTLAMSAMLAFAASANAVNWTDATAMPTEPGNYTLQTDVELGGWWSVPAGTTTIDLNGHGIKAPDSYCTIDCDADGTGRSITLTITDSSPNTPHKLDDVSFTGGYITGSRSGVTLIGFTYACTVNMNGGSIINVEDHGIMADGEHATVNINGGKIRYCSSRGVYFASNSKLNMNNGEISNCGSEGMYLSGVGAVSINSSTITNNVGYGIYYDGSELEINNSNITNNGNSGINYYGTNLEINNSDITNNDNGGVCVYATGNVTIDSCNINSNNGRGIECTGECGIILRDSTVSNNGGYGLDAGVDTFNMYNSDIIGNGDAGVYQSSGIFTMNGGRVCNNTAKSAYSGGVEVGNATFVMNSGEISGNIGTVDCGGVWCNSGAIRLSGSVVINNNKLSDGTESNLYIGSYPVVINGVLNRDSQIGITTNNKPVEGEPVTVTDGLKGKGSFLSFTSDDTDYVVTENVVTGEANLVIDGDAPATAIEITDVLATDKGYVDGVKDSGATAFIARITKLVNREITISGIDWNITPSDTSKEQQVFTQWPNVTLTNDNRFLNVALVIGDLFDKNATAEITIR